jgi:hypothetical protein
MLINKINQLVGPGFNIQLRELTDDIGSWTLDDDLNPVVFIDTRMAELSFSNLSETQLIKFYADPFFGLVTHEHNEALVFKDLVRGITASLQDKYPKSKSYVSQNDWQSVGSITNPEDRLHSIVGCDVAEWDDHGLDQDCMLLCMQMIAHRIIISDDHKAYYAWVKETEKLGLG